MAKPKVSPRLPFEATEEVLETPDVGAFRNYLPSTSTLAQALNARLDASRRQVRDSYGAYSGIPSQVARNRMRDEALQGLDETESLALAEGSERAQALRMSQLEALANLTRKRKQSGYRTELQQPGPSVWPSIIGGVAGGFSSALSAGAFAGVPKPTSVPRYFPSSYGWP